MKEDKMHPEHKIIKDKASIIASDLCDLFKGQEIYMKVVKMVYDLKTKATHDGMYQGIDVMNRNMYIQYLNGLQERREKMEQQEVCECNDLWYEEMSRYLEYNECYDKFECPKCDKLH